MYWQDDDEQRTRPVGGDTVDLSFRLRCRSLPVEHAYELSGAIHGALPWFGDDEGAGLHLIHVAESGNGWMRPEAGEGGTLHLSRRTRLTLRLPRARIEDARALTGATLDIAGHPLTVGEASVRPLNALDTVFSRHVVADEKHSEEQFVEYVVAELNKLDVRVRKLLCGKTHVLAGPGRHTHTRSLMLADLAADESLRLQQRGLGPQRKLGCGLFIGHKGVAAVSTE